MSTGLYIAANSSFTIEEIESKKKYWILELKKLFLNLEEKTIDTEFFEEEEWNYNYYDDSCLINITSPTPYDISIYKEVIIISTIYNYKLIYSNPSWIDDFRNDILEIFNVFTESTTCIFLVSSLLGEFWSC